MIKHMNNRELFSSRLTELQAENSAKNLLEGDSCESYMESYPRRMVIELTNQCNLNCIMCGRTGRNFKKTNFQMDWFKKIESVFDYTEEIVLHGWGVANRVILNGSDIGNNGVIGAGNILKEGHSQPTVILSSFLQISSRYLP